MRDEVIRIVEAYIEAVRSNDATLLPLHPDIIFESPINRIEGIAAFRKGLADFVSILKSIEVIRLTADDETCAAVLKLTRSSDCFRSSSSSISKMGRSSQFTLTTIHVRFSRG